MLPTSPRYIDSALFALVDTCNPAYIKGGHQAVYVCVYVRVPQRTSEYRRGGAVNHLLLKPQHVPAGDDLLGNLEIYCL